MGTNWIKWHKGLAEKPEVVAIAAALKLDRRHIAGACMMLWEWADDNTTDGNVRGVTQAFLDERAGVTGLAAQLKKHGWLDTCDGAIAFPKFDRHNSQSAKNRAVTAERVSRHRNDPVTLAPLLEKRREEKSKKKSGTSKKPAYTPDFEAAWQAYPRKEGKGAAVTAYVKVLDGCIGGHPTERVPWLQARIEAFARSPKGKGQYCPHMATWLNQARYDDDESDWRRDGSGATDQPSRMSPRAHAPEPVADLSTRATMKASRAQGLIQNIDGVLATDAAIDALTDDQVAHSQLDGRKLVTKGI